MKSAVVFVCVLFSVQSFAVNPGPGERTIDHPVPPVTNMTDGRGVNLRSAVLIPGEAKTPDHTVPPAKMVLSSEGYESDYLPGTPIQKRALIEEERTFPAPVSPVTKRLGPGERTIDHPVPPVKGVIHLPRLAEVLTNLSPDAELVTQSAMAAGVVIMTVQLVRAAVLVYTRNPQAAAFVPPVTISNGVGQYTVPGHADYTLGDAIYAAAIISELSEEAALDYADQYPELTGYMLLVIEAVLKGQAEDYGRSCPNPDMCV